MPWLGYPDPPERSARSEARRKLWAPSQPARQARARELAILYYGGCTLQEIGDAVGLTRERVRQLVTPFGLGRPRWTNLEQMLTRYHSGAPLSKREYEAAHALGLPNRHIRSRTERRRRRARVLDIVRHVGLEQQRRPTYGEVAVLVLHRVMPAQQAAPGLINYLGWYGHPRASRILVAIWRKAGYQPARGGQTHRSPHRHSTPRTVCRQGHALTPENVHVDKDGRRRCRICLLAWRKQYYTERVAREGKFWQKWLKPTTSAEPRQVPDPPRAAAGPGPGG